MTQKTKISIANIEKKLKSQKAEFIRTCADMCAADNKNVFPVDLFAIGSANRALHLSRAMIILVKNESMIAAVSLARLHLDTLLRLWSVWLVEKPHDHALAIMGGKRLDHLIDRKKQKLTDSYLVKSYATEFDAPWIASVYKTTSSFVHFSDKAIFQTMSKLEDDGKFRMQLSNSVTGSASEVNELFEFILETNARILVLLIGWSHTKSTTRPYPAFLMLITLCSVASAVLRNLPMLRAAWRMRCSFSTMAMRI
jgi:hypothetical protein